MKTLKTIRIILAALMLAGITALLLGGNTIEGGGLRQWFGWMPKVQLLPAILSLNVVVIIAILVVTLLIGRAYCSVVCPMGVFQDIFVSSTERNTNTTMPKLPTGCATLCWSSLCWLCW